MARWVKNLSAMQEMQVRSKRGRSPGGGNGNPLQYCLGDPIDRRAWQAIDRGVTKSKTQRSDSHTEAPRNRYEHLPKGNSTAIETSVVSHQSCEKSGQQLLWEDLFFLIRVDNKIAYQLCLHYNKCYVLSCKLLLILINKLISNHGRNAKQN